MQEIGIGGCFLPTFLCQWHGEFTFLFFGSFFKKNKEIPKGRDFLSLMPSFSL